MSNDYQNQNNNEDIDLLVLFNYIGEKFNKLFSLIGRIFKWIYSVFIYGAKAVILNIKLISIVVIVAAAIGYWMEESKPKMYDSGMLVRTHFGSKYQLATNLNYYNALLSSEDYQTLSEIFEIHPDTIAKVSNFEMMIGPETENERIKEYDAFVRSIDSVRAQDISFADFVENRDIYSGNLFVIRVESSKRDIFKSLEAGIIKSFENNYSILEIKKRDSIFELRKQRILRSIRDLDSLNNVYLRVIENESESSSSNNVGLRDGILVSEKSKTREFDIADKKVQLNNQLSALEEERVDQDAFFEVISSFPVVGSEVSHWYERYLLILPVLSFLGLTMLYLLKKFTVYVKNYEA